MGVNVKLMSLTTSVHLLTPQIINGFGGMEVCVIFTHVQHVNTPRFLCPDFTVSYQQQRRQLKSFVFCLRDAHGLSGMVITGGLKCLGWET